MKIVKTTADFKRELAALKKDWSKVGFVPTMGYLHEGHLSLVRRCKIENTVTIVSIFVNPAQFGPNEDLASYPRDFDKDEAMLREIGVDLLFYPRGEEIYPPGYATYVHVENLDNVLCGKSRPGHFRGVATVVLKLFNIVQPGQAYFGSKDAQQAVVLKKMCRDLNLDVVIKPQPIVRDPDGLALSSRNVYLSPEERRAALHLPQALQKAKEHIAAGLRDVVEIKDIIVQEINMSPLLTIDYVEVVSLENLRPFPQGPEGQLIDVNKTLAAAAVRVGKTRLIDNFILGEI